MRTPDVDGMNESLVMFIFIVESTASGPAALMY